MKRQMKIAAVVSATALLAIGASFTSMAAAKTGNWVQEDGTWFAYDKNGKMIKDEFVLSNGLEFYVGEDGAMVTEEWVEHEGSMYFINKDGLRTTNIWRELTPYEDPEADEEWYYFDAAGKRVENDDLKIGDETFYFDHEGRVLYGWVDDVNFEEADGGEALENLVYTNERGALVTSDWVEVLPAGEVDGDAYWYYLGSNGNPVEGKKSDINGETYFFAEDGKMLSGWIVKGTDGFYTNPSKALSYFAEDGRDVYYTLEDGHMKANQWVYAEDSVEDDDAWFWIKKNGKVFVPTTGYAANHVDFVNGEGTDFESKYDYDAAQPMAFEKIGTEYYAFNMDGEMQSGLIWATVENEDQLYYFGGADDGAMKTGLQKLEDAELNEYNLFFGTQDDDGYDKGVAVTGAANGYLYEDGVVVKADEFKYQVEKVTIGGKEYTFIVDANGKIQTANKLYEDDGTAIVCTKKSCYTTAPEFSKDAGVLKGCVTKNTDLWLGEAHAEASH